MRSFGRYVFTAIGFTILLLLIFALLRWLSVPAGSLLDWVIGIATFWWLLVVVTVPWNIHFQARSVLDDAAISAGQGLGVPAEQRAYVRQVMRRSLAGALALHLLSAGGLYALAASGISPIGYLGAAAALALTGLRPAWRSYEYFVERLGAIRATIRHPREDVLELRGTVSDMKFLLERLEGELDLERPDSWATRMEAEVKAQAGRLERLRSALEELRSSNQADHQRLAREAEHAIAQISTDGQVIDHVRELIRFFKSA
ncbi:MAG TPA: hypothetical protein VGE07_25840 [Herpetosiphonaceae bacterium]